MSLGPPQSPMSTHPWSWPPQPSCAPREAEPPWGGNQPEDWWRAIEAVENDPDNL